MTHDETRAIAAWALSGRTGASSQAMAAHLLGLKCDGSYPHDGGDFGRCEGLLDAVPSLRGRLGEMASLNAYWAALVPAWEEIRQAPEGDRRSLIRRAIRPVEDKNPRFVRFASGGSMRFGRP